MIVGAVLVWVTCLALASMLVRRSGAQALLPALVEAGKDLLDLLPKLVAALLFAGFAMALVPGPAVADLLGMQSGLLGVAVAIGLGAIVPGGVFVAFPLAVAALHLGMGPVQAVAFLTAWSTLALHRTVALEVPMLGGRFVTIRLMASLGLPMAAAGLSALLFLAFPTPGA